MDREFSSERSDPENRNGAAPSRASSNGNGLRSAIGNGNSHVGPGLTHASTHASSGASAVVRPVPGGVHKGMLKLVDFTQPANGTVSRNADQTLTFRPNPGFTGKDCFDYTLRDEDGATFSATVTVAVSLDVPAAKPAPARASSLRARVSLPVSPRINTGAGLPRLNGGPVLFSGE